MIYEVEFIGFEQYTELRFFGSKKAAHDFCKKVNAEEDPEWPADARISRTHKTPKSKSDWMSLLDQVAINRH